MITFKSTLLIMLALILIIVFLRYLKNGKLSFTSNYFEQKEFKFLNGSIENQILEALKKSNFKKIKLSEQSFSAITLPTIWSFSEKVIVKFEKKNETDFLVYFSSTCLFPLQIFDWGKNQRNASKFFRNIK